MSVSRNGTLGFVFELTRRTTVSVGVVRASFEVKASSRECELLWVLDLVRCQLLVAQVSARLSLTFCHCSVRPADYSHLVLRIEQIAFVAVLAPRGLRSWNPMIGERRGRWPRGCSGQVVSGARFGAEERTLHPYRPYRSLGIYCQKTTHG